MKTDELRVTNDTQTVADALDKIELISLYAGMTRRDSTSMRLLAEEMLAATRNVLEAYEGLLWMETGEKTFSVHLRIARPAAKKDRDKLIALSKTGEAEPPKGMFGRLGAALEKFLLLEDDEMAPQLFMDYAMYGGDVVGFGYPYSYHYLAKPEDTGAKPAAAAAAKDELAGIEKSIIDSIVDDIVVNVRGGEVEIVAVKNLK